MAKIIYRAQLFIEHPYKKLNTDAKAPSVRDNAFKNEKGINIYLNT